MKKPKVNAYGLKGWNLPPAVHKRAVWLVKDYPRIKQQYESMLTDTRGTDGQPRSTDPGDPTSAAAIRRAQLADDVRAVEKALTYISKEDARQIMRHLTQGKTYTVPAHRNTWTNRAKPFIYMVAVLRGY